MVAAQYLNLMAKPGRFNEDRMRGSLRGADSYSAATFKSIIAGAAREFQSKVSMAYIVNGRLRKKQKASSPFPESAGLG
jgi:hypothetical protein